MAGDDAKLERITDLIFALLDARPPIPLSQLAEEIPGYPEGHEARRQAFERDKRLLREEGIVVESVSIDGPEQYGYRIDPSTFFLPELNLDPEERAALNLAVAAVQLGDAHGEEALRKLGIDDVFDVQPIATLAVDPGLDRLFQAIAAAAEVRFRYRGEDRRVAPARLRFVEGHWYLAGWSKERQAGRNFRVDRIEGVIGLGAPGSGAVSDAERIELVMPDGSWERDPDDGAPPVMRLLVDEHTAWKVLRDLGEDRVVEHRADGSMIIEVDLTQTLMARAWVLSLLEHVEIIEPGELRTSLVDWLKAIIAVPPREGPVPRVEDLASPNPSVDQSPGVPPAQRRVRRLLAMLEWLASVGSAPIRDVAERFSMSEDEVVAELELAACCGRPPYSPAELMDIIVDPLEVSARLPEMSRPRQFTAAEGVAIAAAARTLLAMSASGDDGPLARAVAKLEQALGERPAIEVELTSPPLLEQIRRAVEQRRQLDVEYLTLSRDLLTRRVIDPLRVMAVGGHWYAQAYCHRAQALRSFRVDSFKSVKDVGPQPEHSIMLEDAPGQFTPGSDAALVLVSVAPEALWVVDSVPIVARRDEETGSVTIALSVSGRSWFERLALQAGPGFQVLAPLAWTSVGPDAARRILDRYS
jgi:proteasome accessory factor C